MGILEGPHTSKCITMKGEFTFIISNRINSSFTHSILTDPTKIQSCYISWLTMEESYLIYQMMDAQDTDAIDEVVEDGYY